MWEEIDQFVGLIIWDNFKDGFHPFERIYIVIFTCSEEGIEHCCFLCPCNGTRNAAMIYSFLGTYKINNLEPFAWLKYVLTRIPDHSIHKLEELLPGYLPEKSK